MEINHDHDQGDKCPRLGCEIPRYPNLCKISQRPLDGTKCGVNKVQFVFVESFLNKNIHSHHIENIV